jgi:hypothetical protein
MKNGSWGNLEETSFAILFLRRATLTEPEARDVPLLGPGGGEERKDPPRRPHAHRDVPFLRDWLVAGPFAGTLHEDDQFEQRFMDTRRIRPRAGGPAGKRRWIPHRSPEDRVDLGQATSPQAWASFFAATYLHVERDLDAILWLASDDGIKAFLDGEEILFGNHRGWSGDDYYRVPVTLTKGRHLLLLWVNNLEYHAHLRARISGADGKTVEGVTAIPSPGRR